MAVVWQSGKWNYRIVKYHNPEDESELYGLHEVHYREDGEACAMTEHGMLVGESIESIEQQLKIIAEDVAEWPVFLEPAQWAEQAGRGQG